MAELDIAEVEQAQAPPAQQTRFKWMTNILVPARMRGMYLDMLEKLTPDPKIPFVRIVIALGGFALVVIAALYIITANVARTRFIAGGVSVAALGLLMLILVYLVNSRGESMIVTVFGYNVFKYLQWIRSRTGMGLDSFGIEKVDKDCVIKFDDGDVGVAYSVRGQLSSSTLPSIADYIDKVRARYIVGREPTSQEIRITSIEPNDLAEQRDYLSQLADDKSAEGTAAGTWASLFAQLQLTYMDALVKGGNQLTTQQTVIVRDVDVQTLNKSIRHFEGAAQSGMYDRAEAIDDPDELRARLKGMTLGSTVEGGAR